jgi:hypothetical protein
MRPGRCLLPGPSEIQQTGRVQQLPAGNGKNDKEICMRILIPALAAASILAISLPSYSAEDVKAPGNSTKPARALDDGAVKSGGDTSKPSRAAENGAVTTDSKKSMGPSRAAEEGTVKSGGDTTKPARAVDGDKKAAKKKKKKKVETQ